MNLGPSAQVHTGSGFDALVNAACQRIPGREYAES